MAKGKKSQKQSKAPETVEKPINNETITQDQPKVESVVEILNTVDKDVQNTVPEKEKSKENIENKITNTQSIASQNKHPETNNVESENSKSKESGNVKTNEGTPDENVDDKTNKKSNKNENLKDATTNVSKIGETNQKKGNAEKVVEENKQAKTIEPAPPTKNVKEGKDNLKSEEKPDDGNTAEPKKPENKVQGEAQIAQSNEQKVKGECKINETEGKSKKERKNDGKDDKVEVATVEKHKKEDETLLLTEAEPIQEVKDAIIEEKSETKTIPKKDKDEKPSQKETENKTKEPKQNVKEGEGEKKSEDIKKQPNDKNKTPRKSSPPNTGTTENAAKSSGVEIKEHKADALLKMFNPKQSADEKLKILFQKYSELCNDFNILHLLSKQHEKHIALLNNEKEILTLEKNKRDLTREKLENLCRELQKQNKAIREENLVKFIQEEEKRKSVSQKLENTLGEISNQVQENNNKTNKLRDENLDITKKFRELLIQYDQKEQELLEYKTKCLEMTKTETGLRNQISMYSEKYDEFQQTLSRSNEIFAGFKSEMESMSSKINKLEKETATWKQRWEKSHEAYLEISKEKTKSETELLTTCRQLAALLKLCRTLQSERAEMLAKLNGTEPGNKSTKGDDKTQEVIDDTLRELAKSVAETLRSSSTMTENSAAREKANNDSKNIAEPSENSKPSNKKGKNKKR